MSTLNSLPSNVRRELHRLQRLEIRGVMLRDEVIAVTARLRWVQLYIEAGGELSPALRKSEGLSVIARGEGNTVSDEWRRRLAARPLTGIVRRRRIIWKDISGSPHSYFVETLACGHKVTDYAGYQDGKVPRRRRCVVCGDIRVAGRVRRQLVVHDGGRARATTVEVHGPGAMVATGSAQCRA